MLEKILELAIAERRLDGFLRGAGFVGDDEFFESISRASETMAEQGMIAAV